LHLGGRCYILLNAILDIRQRIIYARLLRGGLSCYALSLRCATVASTFSEDLETEHRDKRFGFHRIVLSVRKWTNLWFM